jgi:hypothetical protein
MNPSTFHVIVRAFSSGVMLLALAMTISAIWLMCRPRKILEASWVRPDFQRMSRTPAHRVGIRVLFLIAALSGMSMMSAVLNGILRDPRFMRLMFWYGVAVFAIAGVYLVSSVVIAILRLVPQTRTAINPLFDVPAEDNEVELERKETRLFVFALTAISILVVGIVFF